MVLHGALKITLNHGLCQDKWHGKILPMRYLSISCLTLALALASCTRATPINMNVTPVVIVPRATEPGLQAAVPLEAYLQPTRLPGAPIASPTPDVQSAQSVSPILALATYTPLPKNATSFLLPSVTPGLQSYTVQDGEYPGSIAEKFGVSVDELLAANNMGADSVIYPGDSILIPNTTNQVTPGPSGSDPALVSNSDYFKIIPNSELVYGPLSARFDVNDFVTKKGGYLAFYTQEIDGETLTGAQIVVRVAQDYSINPRLLLALLEYRANWVTGASPAPYTDVNPIGYVDDFHQGLYRQLTWASASLNQGFYGWLEKKQHSWLLLDGNTIVPPPGINAGTAAVQHLFAELDDQATWTADTGPNGLFATFNSLFGYPFDLAVEPLLPSNLVQPALALPFIPGTPWQFTGGPHSGWDEGSAWAALDFAPPELIGCAPSDAWTTAVAPGLIVRAANGAVIEDLDGDGLEQTGWVILYMHMESRDRVEAGTHVKIGDKIGHPSCEGGLADADHLHLARRYNGVWIPAADPRVPFVMDGYVTSGNDVEYDGWLRKAGKVVEAQNGVSELNQIQK